jgi:hypothetical protein
LMPSECPYHTLQQYFEILVVFSSFLFYRLPSLVYHAYATLKPHIPLG